MIYGVKDVWHKFINGALSPEVRSDDSRFTDNVEFFKWVRQHGGTLRDVYVIPEDKSNV